MLLGQAACQLTRVAPASLPLSPAMQNVEALQQAGALKLLRPLLLDNVPRQGSAAACTAACTTNMFHVIAYTKQGHATHIALRYL